VGDEEAMRSRLRVIGPDGSVVVALEPEPVGFGDKRRMRQHTVIAGFPLAAAGRYDLVVEQLDGSDWREEARLPVDVNVMSAAQAEALRGQPLIAQG